MTLTETALAGVWLIDADVFPDERGSFIRAWMPEEMAARGLDTAIAQCSMAASHRRGTIRGMHFQTAPFEETKFIRTVCGSIFDVAVDLRPDSPTFRKWVGYELSAKNRRAMYLSPGIAHGYQTLSDDTEVLYFVSAPYSPSHAAGVRWDDPAFGIVWPLGAPSIISDRDARYPDFQRGR